MTGKQAELAAAPVGATHLHGMGNCACVRDRDMTIGREERYSMH